MICQAPTETQPLAQEQERASLTVEEVAVWLKVPRSAVLRWIASGRIAAMAQSRRGARIYCDDLDAFLESCRVPARTPWPQRAKGKQSGTCHQTHQEGQQAVFGA